MTPVLLLLALYASVFTAARLRKDPMDKKIVPTPAQDQPRNEYKVIRQAIAPERDVSPSDKGKHKPEYENPKHFYETKKIWIDALTLFVGVFTLVLLWKTISVAEKQWKEMVNANRPWLAPFSSEGSPAFNIRQNEEVLNQGNKEIRSGIDIHIHNSGNSPAFIEITRVGWNTYDTFPPNPEFPPCDMVTPPETKTIIPNGEAGFSCVYKGRTELTKNPYVFAEIQYRDVRTNERHYSHSCKQYVPETGGWKVCDTYNDAD